jgi:hypothetical protein
MEDIEKAKEIYADIISSIKTIQLDHNIYCAIPPFIEFNGVIYQHYQCLSQEELFKWGQKAGKQMMNVTQGKVKFYHKENVKDGE